jgi:hypothetical protein
METKIFYCKFIVLEFQNLELAKSDCDFQKISSKHQLSCRLSKRHTFDLDSISSVLKPT